MSISPFTALAQAASAGAQAQSQYQLKLIGDRLTAQLNQKIAALKAQANDPMLAILDQQASVLNNQKASYDTARAQLVTNGGPISDLRTQLSAMSTAAAAGDSVTFDQALAQAQTDLGDLNVVALLPGFQPDGAANLKVNGLGIQSSASYNLSTPAGQAQAAADISAATTQVNQLSIMTTQNTQVAVSASQALGTQVTAINDQVSQKQQTQMTDATNQIQTLQQKTQTEFHLIELAFGNTTNTSSMLQDFEAAQAANAAPGTILDVLDTQLNSSSPNSSAASTTSSAASTRTSSSSTGGLFSTIA